MTIIQVTKCNGCGVERRPNIADDLQELMKWTQIQIAISEPSRGQIIDGWNFCDDCWRPGNLIFDLHYERPDIQQRTADLIEADFQRKQRIHNVNEMESYKYPTPQEVDNAVQDNPEGGGTQDSNDSV